MLRRRVPWALGLGLAAGLALPGCGKKEEEDGPSVPAAHQIPTSSKGTQPAGQPGGAPSDKPAPAPAPNPSPAPPTGPPVEVVLADVVEKDVPVFLEFVGETVGFQDIEVRVRVEGYLQTVDFKEGRPVKTGDLLYTIDPKEFEQAISSATGDVASAKAVLDKFAADVKRYEPLAESGAVSRKELDDARSAEKSAQGKLEAAQAALEQAKLNLGYTKITAPVDGLIGQTKVNVGNLVGRGQNTLLTTISVIDPIKVRFTISEQDLLMFTRQKIEAEKAGKVAKVNPFQLTLADGQVYPLEGEFFSVDRSVESGTGSVKVDVKFANPDRLLRPGNYAKVKVQSEMKAGSLLVPQRAVSEVQGSRFLAVVGPDLVVKLTRVKTGPKVGTEWVITEGLKKGDRVVVDGIQKVKDGTHVVEKAKAPEAPAMGEGK